MKLTSLFSILFLAVITPAMGQSNLMMQASGLPQNMALNPALAPNADYMTIPLLGDIQFGMRSGISINDVLTTDNGVKYLDYSKMLKSLGGKNDINVIDLNLNLLSGGFYISPNDFIGLNLTTRLHVATNMPEGALGFLLDNPLEQIDKTFDVSMSPNIIGWNEVGLSYTRKIGDNFRVGLRAKYLMGMVSMQGSGMNFSLQKTFNGYNIQGDMLIQGGNVDFSNFDNLTKGLLDNPGVAGDIGVEYISNDKRWAAMAAVSDLGAIFWNEKTSSQIKAKNPNQVFQFNGFGELQGLINGNVDFPVLMDSVLTKFSQTIGMDTVKGEKFTTFIPTRYHAMVEYSIDPEFRHNVSVSFFGIQAYSKGFDYSISAGYTYRPVSGRWQLMANYTYRPNIPVAIGLGAAYTSRGFQFYLGMDNLLQLFDLKNTKSFGAHLALNIRF